MIHELAALTILLTALPPAPPITVSDQEGKHSPLASDGEPITAGRIPADSSEAARGLWEKFLAAQSGSAGPSEPIRSFRLGFDLRVREPGSSNDVRTTFAYLADPGWLRFQLEESGRESLHGPAGDYLIDKYGVQEMRGRDFEKDRNQLREFVTVARNFVALTRPDGIRLVAVANYDGPGAPLPTADLEALAAGLRWLEARSPDLRLVAGDESGRRNSPETVYRARLGLDPQSGRVTLAVLSEESSTPTSAALLVHVRSWLELGEYRVPSELVMHRWSDRGFSLSPHAELSLRSGGALNVELSPEDFLPPAR
jgi:hypothetical protein